MAFQLNVNVTGLAAVRNAINGKARQLPFAVAVALTRVAKSAQKATETKSRTAFDRPKTWTTQAWVALPANKQTLTAKLQLKDRTSRGAPQSVTLRHHYLPGVKRRADRAFEYVLERRGLLRKNEVAVIPRSPAPVAKADAYGNISRAAIRKMLRGVASPRERIAGWRYFAAPRGGALPAGVWVERNRQVQPVVLFVDTQRYKQRLDVVAIAKTALATEFDDLLRVALERANATAR